MRATVALKSLSRFFTLLRLNVDDLPSALGLKALPFSANEDPTALELENIHLATSIAEVISPVQGTLAEAADDVGETRIAKKRVRYFEMTQPSIRQKRIQD